VPFFFFIYPFSCLLFLDKKKKVLHNRFAFNGNDPQIEQITEKKYKTQRKKKS
jgi:hypothetical protein